MKTSKSYSTCMTVCSFFDEPPSHLVSGARGVVGGYRHTSYCTTAFACCPPEPCPERSALGAVCGAYRLLPDITSSMRRLRAACANQIRRVRDGRFPCTQSV